MYLFTSITLYAHSNHKDNSYIVDESLVHCHGGCEFDPVTFTCVFFFQFIYLIKDLIHNHFQTIWNSEFRFNDRKQCIPY